MYKALELITTITDQNRKTSYLYNKKEKILLPITQVYADIPHIYNTLYRIIKALNSDILCTKIYMHCNDKYYAYLTLVTPQDSVEINICIKDALNFAEKYNIPIYIRNHILYKNGFNITREMIEKALEND
ncbi:bifunctional nuclease family protein [Patescibacteria group bacterium]|nr:bifunctional nuclease family protein [Patescibacteria group bacterium]